jgi:hypothetical protein
MGRPGSALTEVLRDLACIGRFGSGQFGSSGVINAPLYVYKRNLTLAEANLRIAALTAKRRHPAVSARVARVQSKATAIASILPATFWLACSSKRTR